MTSRVSIAGDSDADSPTTPHHGSAPMRLTGRTALLVWFGSIALHTAGLIVLLFLVFPFNPRKEAPPAMTRVELIGDPTSHSFAPSEIPDTPERSSLAEPVDVRFTPQDYQELSELAGSRKPDLTIIGVGAGGGDFSEYGLNAGHVASADFFGLGASARGAQRIVYVVDRSGSMLDTFIHVRTELKRSISKLRRSQKFHVIFFNSGQPMENPPKKLVSAIAAQKKALFEFLAEVYPEGSTDPGPAMRRALATEPDLVYFLTDGEFDRSLIAQLDQWNRSRRVRIFTIAYFDRSGAELLEDIAREHGGEFKFISENDLP